MRFSSFFIQRLYSIGILLVIVLVLADLLTFFYFPNSPLSDIFLATREQTPLTWVSSLTFLFIALSCFSCYLETKKKIWYFLAVTFFFFSMDDATYFHERLSGFFFDNTELFGFFPSYIWVILYAPLLAFSLGAFVYLLWKDNKRKKYLVISLVVLGFAIFLDFLDGIFLKDSGLMFCLDPLCNKATVHLLRLLEEVLEVFALGILGYINIKKHCIVETKNPK